MPHTAVCFGISGWNATQHQQQLAQHHFSDGSGIGKWRIKDWNTALSCSFQINLVGADTETTHSHQFFCGGENLFAQMRT
ncbi:hypothetical protein D3C78_1841900 [compost metagenome]